MSAVDTGYSAPSGLLLLPHGSHWRGQTLPYTAQDGGGSSEALTWASPEDSSPKERCCSLHTAPQEDFFTLILFQRRLRGSINTRDTITLTDLGGFTLLVFFLKLCLMGDPGRLTHARPEPKMSWIVWQIWLHVRSESTSCHPLTLSQSHFGQIQGKQCNQIPTQPTKNEFFSVHCIHNTNPRTAIPRPEHGQQRRGRLGSLLLSRPLLYCRHRHASRTGKDIKTTKGHVLPYPSPGHSRWWTEMLCFPSAAVLALTHISGLLVLQNQTSSFLSNRSRPLLGRSTTAMHFYNFQLTKLPS